MRNHLSIRLLIVAAVASSALFAVVIPGGYAGSAVKSVSCAGLSTDSKASMLFLSSCAGTGSVQTGSSGTQTLLSSGATVTHGKVTWSTGKTSLLTYTATSTTNTCPHRAGYVKLIRVHYSGSVTGGTATGLIGGSYHGVVCGYQNKMSGALAGYPVTPQDY